MKIKKNALLAVFFTILVYQSVFVSINAIYIPQYGNIKRNILYILLLCLIPYFTLLIKKRYIKFNIVILLIVFSIMVSAKQNEGVFVSYTTSSTVFAYQIALFAWYCEFLDFKGQTKLAIKCIYLLSFMYCVLADILMFVDPHIFVSEWGEVSYFYLVGTKFDLCYLHFLCVILYYTLYNNKKKGCLLILWCGAIAIMSSCSTMLIGTILYAIFILFSNNIRILFEKRIFGLIYLTICSVILLVGAPLLKIPVIQYIIVDVLNESLTLTGRMNIYQKIGYILLLNPIWGGGYDANYYLSMKMTGAADIQNGILDIMISFGIFGIIMFIILLCFSIKSSKLIKSPAIIIGIYVYITLSSVEITFRLSFYCLLIMIILCSWSSDRALKN